MLDLALVTHDGTPWRLDEAIGRRAATVLLPFRGHW
jgi:hypothetical protein